MWCPSWPIGARVKPVGEKKYSDSLFWHFYPHLAWLPCGLGGLQSPPPLTCSPCGSNRPSSSPENTCIRVGWPNRIKPNLGFNIDIFSPASSLLLADFGTRFSPEISNLRMKWLEEKCHLAPFLRHED